MNTKQHQSITTSIAIFATIIMIIVIPPVGIIIALGLIYFYREEKKKELYRKACAEYLAATPIQQATMENPFK